MPLISKDEPIKTSMVNVGYLILMHLEQKADGKASLTEISTSLKKHGIIRYRPITFALCFLHMANVVEFKPPYLYLLKPQG
jgi:hypothetical protein